MRLHDWTPTWQVFITFLLCTGDPANCWRHSGKGTDPEHNLLGYVISTKSFSSLLAVVCQALPKSYWSRFSQGEAKEFLCKGQQHEFWCKAGLGTFGSGRSPSRLQVGEGSPTSSRTLDLRSSKLPSNLVVRSLYSRQAKPFSSCWTVLRHVLPVCVCTAEGCVPRAVPAPWALRPGTRQRACLASFQSALQQASEVSTEGKLRLRGKVMCQRRVTKDQRAGACVQVSLLQKTHVL